MAASADKLMINLTSSQSDFFDACEFGDIERVMEMIHEPGGMDPNKPEPEKGETPLHWAARYSKLCSNSCGGLYYFYAN